MSRHEILRNVRAALAGREVPPHPGPFAGARPHADEPSPTTTESATPSADTPAAGAGADSPAAAHAVDAFARLFTAAGGEVVRFGDRGEAAAYASRLAEEEGGACVGATLPADLRPHGAGAATDRTSGPLAPEHAPLGISMARAAVAETGSLVLDARDGRRVQLLPPTHLAFVRAADVHTTLCELLQRTRADLPSALGLHSGPSKSADIGKVLVRGVHGPGRVIAAVLEGAAERP